MFEWTQGVVWLQPNKSIFVGCIYYNILKDIEATKYQLLEFVDTDDLATLEQTIFEFELQYESVTSFMKNIINLK